MDSGENEICAKCGRQIGNSEMAYVVDGALICVECDAKLQSGSPSEPGTSDKPQSASAKPPSILPSTTVKDNRTRSPKNKATAITLAVFFGPFAWIYLYSRNKRKLDTFLGMIMAFTLFTMILRRMVSGFGGHLVIALVIPLGCLIEWVWAVFDLALKPHSCYTNYWENTADLKHPGKTNS